MDERSDVPFEHVTVEGEDGPAECTIFPRDCSDEEIVTHWITARGGSFVSLADAR